MMNHATISVVICFQISIFAESYTPTKDFLYFLDRCDLLSN